jgi:hypothetical protein
LLAIINTVMHNFWPLDPLASGKSVLRHPSRRRPKRMTKVWEGGAVGSVRDEVSKGG